MRRRLWGATALLFMAAGFGLASFGVEEVPRFRAEGLAPGAWYESDGSTGGAAIHFRTNPPCVFQGPRYAEVRAAIVNARTVTIECAEGGLGAIAIGVEADGAPVLAQRQAAALWTRDSWIAPTGLAVCAFAGTALIIAAIVAGFRRSPSTRGGTPPR